MTSEPTVCRVVVFAQSAPGKHVSKSCFDILTDFLDFVALNNAETGINRHHGNRDQACDLCDF